MLGSLRPSVNAEQSSSKRTFSGQQFELCAFLFNWEVLMLRFLGPWKFCSGILQSLLAIYGRCFLFSGKFPGGLL